MVALIADFEDYIDSLNMFFKKSGKSCMGQSSNILSYWNYMRKPDLCKLLKTSIFCSSIH